MRILQLCAPIVAAFALACVPSRAEADQKHHGHRHRHRHHHHGYYGHYYYQPYVSFPSYQYYYSPPVYGHSAYYGGYCGRGLSVYVRW